MAQKLTWKGLLAVEEGETVEEFLWSADVASVLFSQDPTMLRNILFALVAKFEKYAGIQSRCFQMLQECHLLASPGIRDEEVSPRYDAILRSLSSWIGKADVLLHAFELLSMIADRAVLKKRAVLVEDGQLIFFVKRAIARHPQSVALQRAALQLFEAIIEQATGPRHLKRVALAIFKPVLDNLVTHEEDLSIAISSLSILLSLHTHALSILSPWTDQLLSISVSLVARHSSPELAARALRLIDKLTSEDAEALLTIAQHAQGLSLFTHALHALSERHVSVAASTLELLWRLLDDSEVAVTAFISASSSLWSSSTPRTASQTAIAFRQTLRTAFEHYLSLLTDVSHTEEVQYLFILHSNIDEVLAAMLRSEDEHATHNLLAREEERLQREGHRRSQRSIAPVLSRPRVMEGEKNEQDHVHHSNSTAVNGESETDDAHTAREGAEADVEALALSPSPLLLSRDVAVAVPMTAIDCEPLPEDVVLPEDMPLFAGRAPSSDESSFASPLREQAVADMQRRLQASSAGQSLQEVAQRLGRPPLSTLKPRRKNTPSLHSVSIDSIATSQQHQQQADSKEIHELRMALRYTQVQLEESNRRCDTLQGWFRNAAKSAESLLLENQKLMHRLDLHKALSHNDSGAANPRTSTQTRDEKAAEKSKALRANKAIEDAKLSLAIAGIVEGLDFSGALQSRRYHTAGEDSESDAEEREEKERRFASPLRHSNAVVTESSASPWQYLDELYMLGEQIVALFNIVIETYYVPEAEEENENHDSENVPTVHLMFTTTKRRNTGLISAQRLRHTLLKMRLVDGERVDVRYVDFIFAYLDTRLLTVYGVAFVLIYCGKKKFSALTGIDLLRATQESVSLFLADLQLVHDCFLRGGGEAPMVSESTQTISPVRTTVALHKVTEPWMTRSEFREILMLLGQQESACVAIFRAYTSELVVRNARSSFALANRPGLRHLQNPSSSCPSPTAGSDVRLLRRVAEDTAELEYRFLDGRKFEGMSFRDAMEFATDFQICPQLLSRLQFHEIFHAIACAVPVNGSTASSSSSLPSSTRKKPRAPFSFYLDENRERSGANLLLPSINRSIDYFERDHQQDRHVHCDAYDDRGDVEVDSVDGVDNEDEEEEERIRNPLTHSDSRDDLLCDLRLDFDDDLIDPRELMKAKRERALRDPVVSDSAVRESLSISFRQFLDLLLAIALQSSLFQTEESIKTKLNSFLGLMNLSSGMEHVVRRLEEKEMRVNAAAIAAANAVQSQSLVPPLQLEGTPRNSSRPRKPSVNYSANNSRRGTPRAVEFRPIMLRHPSQEEIVIQQFSPSKNEQSFSSVFEEMTQPYAVDFQLAPNPLEQQKQKQQQQQQRRREEEDLAMIRQLHEDEREIAAEDFYGSLTTQSVEEMTVSGRRRPANLSIRISRPNSFRINSSFAKEKAEISPSLASTISPFFSVGGDSPQRTWTSLEERNLPPVPSSSLSAGTKSVNSMINDNEESSPLPRSNYGNSTTNTNTRASWSRGILSLFGSASKQQAQPPPPPPPPLQETVEEDREGKGDEESVDRAESPPLPTHLLEIGALSLDHIAELGQSEVIEDFQFSNNYSSSSSSSSDSDSD